MKAAFFKLKADLTACQSLENRLRGKQKVKKNLVVEKKERSAASTFADCVEASKKARKRFRDEAERIPESPYELSQLTRHTDEMCLEPYKNFMNFVPRLVNVVTLAEALPVPGSGLKLPLNLSLIAARCSGAFYAPRRFSAVQLAYSSPRCRVLVFHTGRLVGTGCTGGVAARLAIARAQRQLAVEAGVHLHIRSFSIINQVGAVALNATLNCDAFATAHSSTSHFDRHSFVGLAWRPPNENICCEIYSTGRANLPGSTAERQLIESFSRMMPELLRFSSSNHLLRLIPEELQKHHRATSKTQKAVVINENNAPVAKKVNLWDGWTTNEGFSLANLDDLENDNNDDGDAGPSNDQAALMSELF